MAYEVTRRQTLGALGTGGVAVVGGYLSTPGQKESVYRIDPDQFEDVLEIPADTTHTVQTGSEETYDSVLWEGDDAVLELETDARLEITAATS